MIPNGGKIILNRIIYKEGYQSNEVNFMS